MKYKFIVIIGIILLFSLSVISAESSDSNYTEKKIVSDSTSNVDKTDSYTHEINLDKQDTKNRQKYSNKVINKSYKNYDKSDGGEFLIGDSNTNQEYVFLEEEQEITLYLKNSKNEVSNKTGSIKFSVTYYPPPFPGNLVEDTVLIGYYPLEKGVCKFNYTLRFDDFDWRADFPDSVIYNFQYPDNITNLDYNYNVHHTAMYREDIVNETYIITDNVNRGYAGEKITFKGKVVDENNNPVKKGRIVIKINRHTIKSDIYLNNTNEFKYTYTIPKNYAAKQYALDYVYVGNEEHPRAIEAKSLYLLKKSVKVLAGNVSAYAGQKIILKGNLLNNKNKPITTGKIAIKLNGKTITSNVTPNKTGQFSYTYKIPDYTAKKYKITYVYIENQQYTRTETNKTLTIKTQASRITANNITNYQNNTTQLRIKITGTKTNNKATSGNVIIKINGKEYTRKITNGTTTLKYKIPPTLKAGQYKFTITYTGGRNLLKSNKTTTLIVKDHTTKIQSKNIKTQKGKTIKITATINDSIGKIKTGNTTFKLNNKSIGTSKITNGTSTITYTIPESFHGNYTLEILAQGKYTDVNKITRTLTVL